MTTPIARIKGVADVVLTDGRNVSMNGSFIQPRIEMSGPLGLLRSSHETMVGEPPSHAASFWLCRQARKGPENDAKSC